MTNDGGDCAASCLAPEINGDSMGFRDLDAPPAIGDIARTLQVQSYVTRRCSNKNGRGRQCPRPAWKHWKKCRKCHEGNRTSIKRNWLSRMVIYSRDKDQRKDITWQPEEYLTKEWLGNLFNKVGATCYWCGACHLDTYNRRGAKGLQVERLSNDLPHLKRNCVFACGDCNRRSWTKKWDKVPYHLLKYNHQLDKRLSHATKVRQDRICLEIASRNFTQS